MIEIIKGNEEHIPAIVEMAEKTWHATYSKILSAEQLDYMLQAIYGTVTLTAVIRDGSQEFLLLKDNRGLQGFTSFGARQENPQIWKVHKLYILPENQGKGYGTVLIEEIKKRMREKGIRTLDLNVNRYNPAQHFYRKIGFTIIREEDVPIGRFWMNDFVMRLEI